MASKDSTASKKHSYDLKSFKHLSKLIERLKKDKRQLVALRTSFSDNAASLLGCPPVGENPNMDMTSSNNFGNVSLVLEIKEGDMSQKKSLLSQIASKFEAKRYTFAEIESVEYGVSSFVANDRVDLIIQLLKDFPSFHNYSQKLSIKRPQSIWERIPTFLELVWWVIVSLLEEGPTHTREIRVDKPALLPTFSLVEVLRECSVKANLTHSYTLMAVCSKEIYTGKSVPMIIFEDADLDAAIDTCISAAWFSEGLVPWATTAILVHEDIYATFLSSFKSRLEKSAEDASLLYRHPNAEDCTHKNMEKVVASAKKRKLEVFQVPRKGSIPATLVIGDFVSVQVSNTERDTTRTLPILFIVPFSTMDGALAKANSSAEKVAASVWSQSHSTCLSCVSQLNFGTIWVNTHGIFDGFVPFFSQSACCVPIRPTGIDYYHWSKSLLFQRNSPRLDCEEDCNPNPDIKRLLASAFEAHLSWMQKGMQDRIKTLDNVWSCCSAAKFSLANSLRKQLVDMICGKIPNGGSFKLKNCLVSSFIEPVGIVIFILGKSRRVDSPGPKRHLLLKHVLTAIFSRNAVIIVGNEIYLSAVELCLPESILSPISNVSLKNLKETLQKQKLQDKVSIWKLDDTHAECLVLRNNEFAQEFTFSVDFDSRPHMVRRKSVWMPVC